MAPSRSATPPDIRHETAPRRDSTTAAIRPPEAVLATSGARPGKAIPPPPRWRTKPMVPGRARAGSARGIAAHRTAVVEADAATRQPRPAVAAGAPKTPR